MVKLMEITPISRLWKAMDKTQAFNTVEGEYLGIFYTIVSCICYPQPPYLKIKYSLLLSTIQINIPFVWIQVLKCRTRSYV